MSQPAQRVNNRVVPLLDAAAKLFAAKGYSETTIRDIATVVGIIFESRLPNLNLGAYDARITEGLHRHRCRM